MPKMKALDVARYLIAKSDNVGDPITNKKLQKLLYYVKAWGLAYFSDGVIEEQFQAWVHGPVCPIVYQNFRQFGYNPLTIEYNGLDSSKFIKKFKEKHKDEERKVDFIDAVFKKYAVLSSLQLEMLSHKEQPWIEARGDLSPIENGNGIISEESMRTYYSKFLQK